MQVVALINPEPKLSLEERAINVGVMSLQSLHLACSIQGIFIGRFLNQSRVPAFKNKLAAHAGPDSSQCIYQ